MTEVRIAGPADKDAVFHLLCKAHREQGMFPYDQPRVYWWLDRLLQPELIDPTDVGPRGVIGVLGERRLKGVAILVIGGLWYTTQRHLEELIVYVDREARCKGYHKALIEWMKEQSRVTGLP